MRANKGSTALSLNSLVMDEEKMRPWNDFPWIGSVLRVSFDDLILLVG